MGLAKVLKARFGRDPSEAELAAARAERARLKAAEASEAPSEPAPAPPAKRAKSAGGPSAADLVTPAKSKGSSSRLEDIDDDEVRTGALISCESESCRFLKTLWILQP